MTFRDHVRAAFAAGEQVKARQWGAGWLCRYPGERSADDQEHRTAADAVAAAWRRWELDYGAPVEIIILHDGPELQHVAPGVQPVSHVASEIARQTARRAARRGDAPPPSGGLFDFDAHRQQDLFA